MMLATLALLFADLPALAPPQATSQQLVAMLVLPAGTPVRLSTVDLLDSRSVSQGQRFKLQVVENVTVGSIVVIPRGTAAVGEVEAVSGKGMVGKSGRLVLRPLFIEIAGRRVNLVGTSSESGKDATGGVAVASVLTNGLGLFITGRSASVPPGSAILGQVRTDVTLPPVTSAATLN
jgi:hypothetical protein